MATELAIERLSQTEAWRMLSPTVREILSALFAAGDRDLAKAVATANPHFSAQRAAAVATSMLSDNGVQAVLLLRSGEVVLSDAPKPGSFEDLIRRKEWRALEPLNIRVRPDDTSEETLDLQRILRLYLTSARENMIDAIGMFRPDFDQSAVAEAAKLIWESPSVRRILQIRRGGSE